MFLLVGQFKILQTGLKTGEVYARAMNLFMRPSKILFPTLKADKVNTLSMNLLL